MSLSQLGTMPVTNQGKAISYCSVSGKEDVTIHQLHSQLKLSSLRGQRRESETGLKSNRLIITPSLKQQCVCLTTI